MIVEVEFEEQPLLCDIFYWPASKGSSVEPPSDEVLEIVKVMFPDMTDATPCLTTEDLIEIEKILFDDRDQEQEDYELSKGEDLYYDRMDGYYH